MKSHHLLLLGIACAAAHAADVDRFPFAPAVDDFRPGALLDLRSLNEAAAGEHGWVTADGKGGFLRGDGQPLRFWAVGSFVQERKPWTPRPHWHEKTEPSLERHARFLAKHGVNLARMHTSLNPDTKARPDAKLEELDPLTRDYIWEFVAAMKKAGIYSMLTPYWANAFKPTEAMGFGTDDAHALLFFDPRMKAAYKGWLRELLTTPNPHTGVPLARDPALAIIQIQNEDATLFWTISHLKGKPQAMLNAQYREWLVKKHGSEEAARAAWGLKPDRPLELKNIYELTQERGSRQLDDQTEFWSRMMFDFHREIVAFLRDELGCKQLVSAGNWHTASTERLNDALRWTYTATDIQGVNRYFPGHHSGDQSNWTLKPGHIYNSRTFLMNPLDWPLQLKLPVNQPFIITESSWTFPTRTAAEGPLLIAAYQGLTGLDAFCWFAFDHEQWQPPQSGNGYMKDTQQKFIAACPDTLGQFPAAAIIARMGCVKQGEPVIHEARPLADLWQRKLPLVAESASHKAGKADARAFFIGPVEAEYDVDAAKTRVTDLSPFISGPVIRGNTGEHTLDTAKGSFTLDTPRAQGVAAFFKNQRRFQLSEFSVSSENDYGTCVAVSLDGKPLAESSKVLLQAGTNTLPSGWAESPAPADAAKDSRKNVHGAPGSGDLRVIDSLGKAPWMMEKVRMAVSVKNSRLTKATALDANGYARPDAVLVKSAGDGWIHLTMPEDALHVILE